jgi:hypothetical protein
MFAAAIAAFALAVLPLPSVRAAGTFPLTVTLDAKISSGATSVASKVTIQVDRPIEEMRRTRLGDALKYNGYPGFLPALRAVPVIGSIKLPSRGVDVRYAHEQPAGDGKRIVIIGDRPLFFLSSNAEKPRAGYELTVVDLRIDAQGGITGTMAGAARVKTSPEGPVLDDFAEAPAQLAGRMPS